MSLLGALKLVEENNLVTQIDIDEISYCIEDAFLCIQRYKRHLMRAFAQNSFWGSLLLLEQLDHVIAQQDWSMNFLPIEFRENQTNWFGKKVCFSIFKLGVTPNNSSKRLLFYGT